MGCILSCNLFFPQSLRQTIFILNLRQSFLKCLQYRLEKFFEKKHYCVFIFKTGLYTLPASKYKTSTLSKFTEVGQYSNTVFICVRRV